MRSRLLALGTFLILSSASLSISSAASARDTSPSPQAPSAPAALFVDGVKIGATAAPKVRSGETASRSCSSCTLMVTH